MRASRFTAAGIPATPGRACPAHTRPAAALRATRRHWQIEHRLHWPRDVTLGEDACRVRAVLAQHARRRWRPFLASSASNVA
jgi:hypothetical protein